MCAGRHKTAKVSVSGVGLGLNPAGLGLGLGVPGLGLGLPGLDNISENKLIKIKSERLSTNIHD